MDIDLHLTQFGSSMKCNKTVSCILFFLCFLCSSCVNEQVNYATNDYVRIKAYPYDCNVSYGNIQLGRTPVILYSSFFEDLSLHRNIPLRQHITKTINGPAITTEKDGIIGYFTLTNDKGKRINSQVVGMVTEREGAELTIIFDAPDEILSKFKPESFPAGILKRSDITSF